MNKLAILGLLRHILTFGGGFLVAKGVLDDGTLQEVIGGVVTIVGALWSFFAPEKR